LKAARERPFLALQLVSRGKNKGKYVANIKEHVKQKRILLGIERALIYKIFLTTGLREDELRTLTIAQLYLDNDKPFAQLHPEDEKNREGNKIPFTPDLAEEIRQWIKGGEVRDGKVAPSENVFYVPDGLIKILNRDLKWAGIEKKDFRGKTLDVHAMRHTYGTNLTLQKVSPRLVQKAMRHNAIDLTMNTYTDADLIDVFEAQKMLPKLAVTVRNDPPNDPPDSAIPMEKMFVTGNLDKVVGAAVEVADSHDPVETCCESTTYVRFHERRLKTSKVRQLLSQPKSSSFAAATPAANSRTNKKINNLRFMGWPPIF
jgi:hypothetical protein